MDPVEITTPLGNRGEIPSPRTVGSSQAETAQEVFAFEHATVGREVEARDIGHQHAHPDTSGQPAQVPSDGRGGAPIRQRLIFSRGRERMRRHQTEPAGPWRTVNHQRAQEFAEQDGRLRARAGMSRRNAHVRGSDGAEPATVLSGDGGRRSLGAMALTVYGLPPISPRYPGGRLCG